MKLNFQGINIFKPAKSYRQLPVPQTVWQDPLYFSAFGFGSGTMPFAPGTFGTLLALIFYLLLPKMSVPYYLLFVLFFTLFSILICDKVSKEIHTHDHPGMCIDEFPGFFVTMINAPFGLPWIILGFVLFRFFDIWKPWPIMWVDRNIHGGFGMVLDDLLAGVYALIIMQLLHLIF